MENRYLFRGKRIDNNEWVYGLPSCDEDGEIEEIEVWSEDDINFYSVDPETICQCTGIKDKYRKLIWENDILHNGNYFVVKWNAPCARFDIVLNNSHNIPIGKWEPMICDWETNDFKGYRKSVDYEVIGNTFDNPELLEV